MIFLISILSLFLLTDAHAAIYPLPSKGNIIGQVKYVVADHTNLEAIGREYGIGYYEIVEANPKLNPIDVPLGANVVIPSEYILPTNVRKGIVVNVAELRLFYFLPKKHEVFTVPVGIGKVSWRTPVADMKIVNKIAHPTWVAPANVIKEDAKNGITVPKVIPPGPNNPLGQYALRLSKRLYLIHGTSDPSGVGKRVSSGCIRMHNHDIQYLFNHVNVGTNVSIVNEPLRIGWSGNKLYLEANVPLSETKNRFVYNKQRIKNILAKFTKNHAIKNINWDAIKTTAEGMTGVPRVVGSLKSPKIHYYII